MKLTVAKHKDTNKGINIHDLGEVVTCEAYPHVPYMVIETDWALGDGSKTLVNLDTGKTASKGWVDGQIWYAREAELIVK